MVRESNREFRREVNVSQTTSARSLIPLDSAEHRPEMATDAWRGALHLIAPAFGPSTPVGTGSRRGDLSAAAPNVLTCVRFCRQRAF
jgi:hypothetical protein